MREMDLLAFFHTEKLGSDEVVSGKIFDYILARRPILIIGPRDMEAVRIVDEYSLGYWMDPFSPDHMESGLQLIFEDWKNNHFPSLSGIDVSVFSRSGQYKKVLGLLR